MKNLKKKLQSLFSRKERFVADFEIMPYRDWKIIFMIFFCGFLALLVFNIFLSLRIDRDNLFITESTKEKNLRLNRDGLSKVIEIFDAKEVFFENMKIGTTTIFVDPSR